MFLYYNMTLSIRLKESLWLEVRNVYDSNSINWECNKKLHYKTFNLFFKIVFNYSLYISLFFFNRKFEAIFYFYFFIPRGIFTLTKIYQSTKQYICVLFILHVESIYNINYFSSLFLPLFMIIQKNYQKKYLEKLQITRLRKSYWRK